MISVAIEYIQLAHLTSHFVIVGSHDIPCIFCFYQNTLIKHSVCLLCVSASLVPVLV